MTTQRNVTIVLVVLGAIAIIGLGLMGACALLDKPVPEAITAATTTAIGAEAGMLVSTRSTLGERDREPTVVTGAQAISAPPVMLDPPPTPEWLEKLKATDPQLARMVTPEPENDIATFSSGEAGLGGQP